jgi:hypothetical protein
MHCPYVRDSGVDVYVARHCARQLQRDVRTDKAKLKALETHRAHSLSVTADNGVATFSSDLRSASTPQIAATTAAPIISAEPTR